MMKTWMWVLTVALAVSVAVNLAAIGTFALRRLRPPLRFAPEVMRGARPETREELRELWRGLGLEMDSLRRELAEEQRGLALMLRRTETSGADVDSAVARIGSLHATMTRTAFDCTRRAMQKLTPEQQEVLLRRFERQYDRSPRSGRRDRDWHHGRWHDRRRPGYPKHGQRDSEPPAPELPGDGR